MKTFASALALTAFTLATCMFAAGMALAAPADAARFQMEVVGPTVLLKGCTGSIVYSGTDKDGVASTYVLTARHCVKGSEQEAMQITVPVYDRDLRRTRDEVYYAEVFMSAFVDDLALLKLLDSDKVFPVVAKVSPTATKLSLSEPVWVVGYPMGMALQVAEGMLGPIERIGFGEWKSKKEWQRAAIVLTGGNSGGALWHIEPDGSYAIAGVVTAGIQGSLLSVFETRAAVHEFLKRLPADVYAKIDPDKSAVVAAGS